MYLQLHVSHVMSPDYINLRKIQLWHMNNIKQSKLVSSNHAHMQHCP